MGLKQTLLHKLAPCDEYQYIATFGFVQYGALIPRPFSIFSENREGVPC